jgi:hypothetical protein
VKPIPVMLGAAGIARVLWWLPPWVTLAMLGAIVLTLVGGHYLIRWRVRHPRPLPEIIPDNFGEWKECGARHALPDSSFLVCVQRSGHEGDHVADRSSVSWFRSA